MKSVYFLILGTLLFCSTRSSAEKIEAVKNYSKEIEYLKSFSKKNGYNQNKAIMIDYSLHSGKNRFFIVDLKTEKIIDKALVCHGSCKNDQNNAFANSFSNTENSYCTSLGMALIGERAYSSWGSNYKFWLDGLENSNSNMRRRVVVLHSWEGVADQEVYPKAMAMSWGCPTISIQMLAKVDQLLKSEKKVLLYSFN